MSSNAQTAAEAYDRYRLAFDGDLLIQSSWHSTADDGRHLACALGVIGDSVDAPVKCPATIMPRWLAQMVVWFFDKQSFDDAKAWGLKFYEQIARLDGQVPFSVIHDWQANVVGPLAIEIAEKRKRNVEVHRTLQTMQSEALSGKKFSADEWREVLRPAIRDADAYANAYAYADANAYAYANADADAYANAYANAYAYADAYAYANANADAYAYAYAVKRLADGMIECLARVPST